MERNQHETICAAMAAEASGNGKEARRLYKLLLQTDPGNIQAKVRMHSLMGGSDSSVDARSPSEDTLNQLFSEYNAGSLKKAERLSRLLCTEFPYDPIGWKVLGAVLLCLGSNSEAAEVCRKAIDLSSSDVEPLHNLGSALLALGHFHDAEGCFRTVIASEPSFAGAYNNLAIILKQTGRIPEAEEIYKKAVMLDPACAIARSNLGNTLAALGDFEGAKASLEKAICLRPSFAEAHRYLASIKQFTEKDDQYQKMYELHQRPETSPEQRCHLSFGLAKACEDLGFFESSFNYYSKGNALRKQAIGYDSSQDGDLFKTLKTAYAELARLPPESAKHSCSILPVFVVGMPRSGTTLVEQIMSSHSEVTGAGELPYVANFGRSMATGSIEITPSRVTEFRRIYLQQLEIVANDKKFVIDKSPQNFLYLGLIQAAFPEAKVVHVSRSAKAVCWANFKQYFPSDGFGYCYSLADIASYYALYEDLMAFWKVSLAGTIHEVDYELLTVNQKEETQRLIKHLGLEWEERCLRPERNDRAVATASNLQIREKIYAGSSEKWRNFSPYIGEAFAAL